MSIRDEILMAIDREPMTYSEIAERFGIDRSLVVDIVCDLAGKDGIILSIESVGPGEKRVGIMQGGSA